MYLGIDLGTSNSAVAGNSGGVTRVFKTADGTDVLPSVIYVDKRGHKFVGAAAQARIMKSPQSVGQKFKRLMGTKSAVHLAGRDWSPVECSAEILRTLVAQAVTEGGGGPIKGTVITTPAAFNQMQSEATMEAAHLAGLSHVALLQEPVAAAMAAIAHGSEKDGVFLVYDLGGGTFDVALVMAQRGAVTVIAHEGINMLGGADFDRAIFDGVIRPWLLREFDLPANFQGDPRYKNLPAIGQRAAEMAKMQLSTMETAAIFASEDDVRTQDLQGEDIYISIELDRDRMISLIRGRLDETIPLCRKILTENGFIHSDIARIVPIGGPSKMPFVRDLLETELGIRVDQGLDPMTAVAVGAAIFAESREWTGTTSNRKPSRGKEVIEGPVALTVDFNSRISEATTRVRITPDAPLASGHQVEIRDSNGGTTGMLPLDGAVNFTLALPQPGVHRFRIRVQNPAGHPVEQAARDFTITRTEATATGVPMTYCLAIKVQDGSVGRERNVLHKLLDKGTLLPASGRKELGASKTIRHGDGDNITFELFELGLGDNDPEHNLHIGDFHLQSDRDLEPTERIARKDLMILHWALSDNSTLAISLEVPKLGRVFKLTNLYFADRGHINYEGRQGAEVAAELLHATRNDLEELDKQIEGRADPANEIRDRLEQMEENISLSVDADTNRSVVEAARKIRQDIALIRRAPQNVERVLLTEAEQTERQFDRIRTNAGEVECDRFDKLSATLRRAIRDKDFDTSRAIIAEMHKVNLAVLIDMPSFNVDFFRSLAEEESLAIDPSLHRNLVKAGLAATLTGDIDTLRSVIRDILQNRHSTGGKDVAELADVFWV